jgi:uracil-DNA glycosylase
LMVIDYPTIEDDPMGVLFSGLNQRAVIVNKIIRSIGIGEDNFSFMSLCSCVTRSKAVIKPDDFIHCSYLTIPAIMQSMNIKGIVCFGSIAGEIMTGHYVKNIEDSRGNIYKADIPETDIPAVVTYSLSVLTGSGCSSCGGANARFHLVRKDIEKLIIKMKTDGVKFVR